MPTGVIRGADKTPTWAGSHCRFFLYKGYFKKLLTLSLFYFDWLYKNGLDCSTPTLRSAAMRLTPKVEDSIFIYVKLKDNLFTSCSFMPILLYAYHLLSFTCTKQRKSNFDWNPHISFQGNKAGLHFPMVFFYWQIYNILKPR